MITVDINGVEVEELRATGAQNTHILGQGEFTAEVGTQYAFLAGAELVNIGPIFTIFRHLNLHIIEAMQVTGIGNKYYTGYIDLAGQLNHHVSIGIFSGMEVTAAGFKQAPVRTGAIPFGG